LSGSGAGQPTSPSRRGILLYLIKEHYKLYGKLYGRKKIQKLLFLVEHLDLTSGRVMKSTGLTGYRFKIWLYGPFSEEIYRDLEELVDRGEVEEEVVGSDVEVRVRGLDTPFLLYEDDGFPKVIYIYSPRQCILPLIVPVKGWADAVPEDLKKRVGEVLRKYGSLTPTQLEGEVYRMLDLTQEKKLKYMGIDIDAYLENEGLV